MHWAKQSTAVSYVVGPILDSTGAEYASAVIGDLSLSKNGGTLTALASAATLTYIANGNYTLALTTGNTDTLGTARIFCNKSTYQMPPLALMVLPATVYDALTTNAAGAANGFFIAGTNAATTITTALTTTFTGNLTGSVGGVAFKKNTALANFEFLMTDSTTHAPVTGKTVTCTRSIDGAAFAAGTLANVAEVANGVYRVDFGAGDLNGNVVTLRATATGSDDTFVTITTNP
jgi:hypothetical protein